MNQKITLIVVWCVVMSLIPFSVWGQERTITGRVTASNDGLPVIYATVAVKDHTNLGQYTDENGRFTLTKVPASATHIQISYIGFVTQEIPIAGVNNVNVVLEPDALSLEQVVVTALGIQRQAKELGYSTAKVGGDDLTQAKATDATSALIGKVSGLNININSATLDGAVRVNLRGSRSLRGSNQALLVVDGITTPLEYLQTMNPDDIDNISVLKGASAAALYGSQAANGVLYVTTRKGMRGRPRINYSVTTTVDHMAYFPQYQTRFGAGEENSTTGFSQYNKEENQQYGPEFDGSIKDIGAPIWDPIAQAPKQLQTVYSAVPGGREAFYKPGFALQNNLSYSSGDENGSFFLSYQRVDQQGTIKGDEHRRQTIRFSGSKLYKNFRATASVNYSNQYSDMNNSSSQGMANMWNNPANVDLREWEDWRNVEGGNPNDWINTYYLNPWSQIDIYRRGGRRDRLSGSANLDYTPTDWLRFQFRGGMNLNINNSWTKTYPWHFTEFAKASGRSYAQSDYYTAFYTQSTYGQRVNLDAMAFAEHEFSKKFKIDGMLGWSLTDNYSESKAVEAAQMEIDEFFNVKNKMGELSGSNSWSQARNLSIYGYVNFSAFGWLYGQITGRNDWTSYLAPEYWSFFYPGANVSVMLSDALPSIKKNKIISYLKLRAGYANVGTVNIGNYELENLVNPNSRFPFGNLSAYTLSTTLRNRHIKPEMTNEFEVGAEIGLLRDRIVFEAAYYIHETSNQTVNTNITIATGASSMYTNVGTMRGQGIELDLKLTPLVRAGDFRWNLILNYSWQESIVTSLTEGISTGDGELNITDALYAIEGKPYPQLKATDFQRTADGLVIVNPVTGLPSTSGLVATGCTVPKHRFGVNSVMRWKGLSLNATLDYKTGHVVRFAQENYMLFTGSSVASAQSGRQRFVWPNSVIKVGEDASGNPIYEPNTNITTNSGGKTLFDGTYKQGRVGEIASGASWKLREVSLNYSLPDRWIENTFLQRVQFGLVGRNLFIWTPDTNVWGDPDFSGSSNSNGYGLSANVQAGARTFGFTASITF